MSSDFELDPQEVMGSGQKVIEIAGEALADRELVRYGVGGLLFRADASAEATLPCIGITLAAASAGQRIEILLRGFVGLSTWTWTPGDNLYVGDATGTIVAAPGTVAQRVAVARSATQILFEPKEIDLGSVTVAHILATTGPHTNTLPLTDLEVGVRGEIIHRGVADWEALGVGVALQALLSGGPGADVSWGAPTPAAHVLATTGPHTNTLPLTDLAVGVRGEVIIRGAADWEALGVGVALQALLSGGAGADPYWGAPTPAAHEASHNDGGADEIEIDDLAGANGAAGEIVESDGAAMSFVEPDGRYTPAAHALATTGPHNAPLPLIDLEVGVQGEVIHRGAADWEALAVGNANDLLTSGGAGANVSWQAPAAAADTRTSTIVVAASNSLDATLAPAAYRCTGVNDEVEMNAALVAAAAVNGRVELLEGDYNTILTLSVAADVTLVGNGWGSVINFNAAGNAVTIAGDNVKLRDFKVVIVAGAGGAGTRPNCVYATGRTNVEITKLWLVGDKTVADDGSFLRQTGILFGINMAYSKIAFCTIEDQHRVGIKFTGTLGNEVVSVDIADNIILNCDWDAIRVDFTLTSTIRGNICYLGLQDGLTLHEATMYCTVAGNTCEGYGSNGIYMATGANYNTLIGNTCTGNNKGIQISPSTEVTLVGNICNENASYNIAIPTGSSNIVIVGNTCNYSTNNDGLFLQAADNCTVVGNQFIGNAWSGIRMISAANGNTLTGNVCYQNGRHGILLDSCLNNTIVGNTCNENDVGDTNTYDGICIEDDCSYNYVSNNTCNDNDRWGISIGVVGGPCIRNWVKDNHLRGNTSGPFSDGAFGEDTILAVKIFQFTQPYGGDAAWQTTSPIGFLVDGAGDSAQAVGEAPLEVQMVVRFRVKGVGLAAPGAGKGMLLEININAGKPTGHEAYNAEAIAVASVISTEDNFAVNDAVEWIIDAIDDADIDDIEFGETMEMFAIFEDTGANGDIATNAVIRTISMEYV